MAMDPLSEKTLLIITPVYPNEDGTYHGGVFVKDQVDAMRQHFREVVVIAPILRSVGLLPEDSLCRDYQYENVRVYFPRSFYIPWPLYRRFGLGSLYYDSRCSAVDRLIREKGIAFDLIHAHFVWPSADIGRHLKEQYGVPVVVTAHGYDAYELPFLNEIWERRARAVLNAADAIITVSKRNEECIRRLGVTKPVHVIPNGFRSDLFYPRDQGECRRVLGLPLDRKILLTVGNLVEVKGHRYLVEAMGQVVKEREDVLCVIVGSGPLKGQLERQIRDLGLEGHVRLVGGRPHEEIPLWMNACDVFVLPSLNEGNPTVMFECLGCGRPFVGSDVGGVGDIISSDAYGHLVRSAHSGDLAENILLVLEEKWNSAMIATYADHYTWTSIIGDIRSIYGEVIRESVVKTDSLSGKMI